MAKMKLSLESGGPKRVELAWDLSWKSVRVTLDGKQVGQVDGKAALEQGSQVRLPDGSSLHLQLVRNMLRPELHVLRDGQPLPGSPSDPTQRVRTAGQFLFFMAALNTLLGVIAIVSQNVALQEMGMGISSILFGGIVATLGFFTYRGSRVASLLAMVLYVSDTLFTLAMVAKGEASPSFGAYFVRFYLLTALWQAFQAAGELARQAERPAPGLAPPG